MRHFGGFPLFALWLAAAPAFGQEMVNVRAQENTTYSRIAIPIDDETQWEFTTFGRQANLRFLQSDVAFDVSGVFDRIPKTRVLNISSDQEGGASLLQLSFACDCPAEASLSGGYLMIDVRDPVAREAATLTPADIEIATAQAQAAAAPQNAAPPSRRPPREIAEATPEAADQAPEASSDPEEDLRQVDGTEGGEPNTPQAQDVAELLMEQLQRAADQGLVDIDEPPRTPQTQAESAPIPPAPTPSPQLKPFEENIDGMEDLAARLERALEGIEDSPLSDAIRLQLPKEVIDNQRRTPRTAPLDEPQEAALPEHCLDDYLFDFSVLDGRKRPAEQVVELRSKLIGEFDAPDPTTALELARLYIALGMGVEARALADEFITDPTQKSVLGELALVVEGQEIEPGGPLDKSADCPGPAALWRTAGFSATEVQPVPEPDQIVEGLAELPVALRRQIVPRAVASFIARDQISAAEASFAILDRAPGYHGPQHEFQRAALLHISGQVREAEAIYLKLSMRSDPTGPHALVALVDSMVQRGRPVPTDIIGDVAAMARQFQDDPLGAILRHTEIIARAGNGKLGEALNVIAAEIEENPDLAGDYLAVADLLFRDTNAEDITAGAYATAIFDHMAILKRTDISQDARLHVAEELTAVGLPAAAISLMEPLARPADEAAPESKNDAARAALARAYLKLDQPDEVLSVLASEPTDVETNIRIAALTKLGRHEAALAEANLLDTKPDVSNIGFRAGAWELATDNDALNGALARYMMRIEADDSIELPVATDPDLQAIETPTEDYGAITLELAQAMRSQSESIRRVLAKALEN